MHTKIKKKKYFINLKFTFKKKLPYKISIINENRNNIHIIYK
jgi:hypothetical protein